MEVVYVYRFNNALQFTNEGTLVFTALGPNQLWLRVCEYLRKNPSFRIFHCGKFENYYTPNQAKLDFRKYANEQKTIR